MAENEMRNLVANLTKDDITYTVINDSFAGLAAWRLGGLAAWRDYFSGLPYSNLIS